MKTQSTHAQAAKCIRQDLKKEFPLIKFRVTSKSYSGGNSISVYWENGPDTELVGLIINKYQEGSFNGMEDIYEYDNTNYSIPQVKHVFANREVSESIKEEVFAWLQQTHPHFSEASNIYETCQALMKNWGVWQASHYIHRILYKTDLTHGWKGV
jgi:hypothetical protein